MLAKVKHAYEVRENGEWRAIGLVSMPRLVLNK